MNKFGIFSPFLGLREDFPSILLRDAFSPEGVNVQFEDGAVKSYKRERIEFVDSNGNNVNPPDGTPVIWYHTHTYGYNNAKTLFAATQLDIYKWVSSSNEWVSVWKNYTTEAAEEINYVDDDTQWIYFSGDRSGDFASEDKLSWFYDFTGEISTYSVDSASYSAIPLDRTKVVVTRLTGEPLTGAKFDVSNTDFIRGELDTLYTEWSFASFGDDIVATNNSDAPLIWTPTSDFATINSSGPLIDTDTSLHITKAKEVVVYNNYCILIAYATSDGEEYPHGIAWSALGYPTEWETGTSLPDGTASDAGQAAVEGKGNLVGAGIKNDLLYVFKTESVRKYWFTGSDVIFASSLHNSHTGTQSPKSIVNDAEGNLYYYASDMTFKEIDYGEISQPITESCKNIVPSLFKQIVSVYIPELDEIWWSVPENVDYTDSAKDYNNRIYTFSKGVWSKIDASIVCFGSYERNTTWTWLILPFSSWNEWSWESWDYTEGQEGFKAFLASGVEWILGTTISSDRRRHKTKNFVLNSKRLYENIQNTTAKDSTAETVLVTDLAQNQALAYYKRLLSIRLYFKDTRNSSVSIYVAEDDTLNWNFAGTVSLSGNMEIEDVRIPVDFRSRTFRFKIASDIHFELIGATFEYVRSGDR